MKFILVLGLILVTLSSASQVKAVDTGGGDYFKLGKAVAIIELMEQGNITEVYSVLPKGFEIDSVELDSNIRKIAAIHPFVKGSTPASFVNNDSSELWYKRTYYTITDQKIDYQLQVCVLLSVKNNTVIITSLSFNNSSNIVQVDNEIKKLQNVVDLDNPPPAPPAPPAMK